MAKPPVFLGRIVAAVIVVVWLVARLALAPNAIFPVTYVIPLLIGLWTRDRIAVWAMATVFIIGHAVKQFWILPTEALPQLLDWATIGATVFNIVIGAAIVHFIINLRDRLDQTVYKVQAANAEVRAQAAELEQQNEELTQQTEELEQQSEEMSEQNEELQGHSEIISELNAELTRRTEMLQSLLDSARLQRAEETVLNDICVLTAGIFGSGTCAVIYEIEGATLAMRGGAGTDYVFDHPAARPAESTFVNLVIQTERTAALNDTLLRPDLSILELPGRPPFRAVLAAPFRIGGQVSGTVAIYRDQPREWFEDQFALADWVAAQSGSILETLRLQNDLRVSRAKMEAALASMTDAVFISDAQGRFIEFNNAFVTFHRFQSRAECPRTLAHYLDSLDFNSTDGTPVPHEMWPLQRALGGEVVTNAEYILRRKGTGETWVGSYSFGPIRDADGAIAGSVVVGRDITDQKRADEELRKAHEELEQRVEERTAQLRDAYDKLLAEIRRREILEEQLGQAQKMQAIGTLAGGIAHDFNNMLAVIMGNAELALDDDQLANIRVNLNQILRASKRSRDLVKQILTFSRREGGEVKAVDMSSLVKETYELLRASLPPTIHMHLDIQSKDGTMLADPSQVQQVILNLANNAAQAMEHIGTLTIGLSSVSLGSGLPREDMKPGTYLKLTVEDTGTGILPEVQRRMFEPFYTTKKQGQGTGMGLSVVYGIVKAYSGVIDVKTEVGKGSKFIVFLPKSDVHITDEDEQEGYSCSAHERILFIDDEPDVLSMTKSILERLNCSVVAFTDASDALKLFEDDPYAFDLIITDQVMPGMTGTALTKEILVLRKDIPVILCTGYSETVSPEMAREAGVREFVMKPVTKKEMGQAIRRVLEPGKEY